MFKLYIFNKLQWQVIFHNQKAKVLQKVLFEKLFYNKKTKNCTSQDIWPFLCKLFLNTFYYSIVNSFLKKICNHTMICIYMFFQSSYTISLIIGLKIFSFFSSWIKNIYKINITQNASHDFMTYSFNLFLVIHGIKCPT